MSSQPVQAGLDSVVVAETHTSLVDGQNGVLVYSGYAIEDLAANALFEDVVYLLWNRRLPSADQLEALRADIAAQAAVPSEVLTMMQALPTDANPMAVLRTATSALAHYDPDSESNERDAVMRKAVRLTGQLTTITAAWDRIRKGKQPIAPRADFNLAQNFLYMLTGDAPLEDTWRAINVYLVLLAEHGMNASTFTARVVSGTQADLHSAIVAAIGALKGASHGGANTEAMNMFLEIGDEANVEAWFNDNIRTGQRRIMGIGHRIYKALDPRAAILKQHAEALSRAAGNLKWYNLADTLDTTARADQYFIERRLYPNVDYYSAIVLYTLDLDTDMFTPLFAMSRVAGWSAHVMEQMGGRLIRPESSYVGPLDLTWTPPSER